MELMYFDFLPPFYSTLLFSSFAFVNYFKPYNNQYDGFKTGEGLDRDGLTIIEYMLQIYLGTQHKFYVRPQH